MTKWQDIDTCFSNTKWPKHIFKSNQVIDQIRISEDYAASASQFGDQRNKVSRERNQR